MEAWGVTGLLLGLLSLGAGPPHDWWSVACFAVVILWLEGFAVDLGGTARLLPVRAVYLAAALQPAVGPAFAALMCLSECAWRHRRQFLAFLSDRLGILTALFLAFLLQKSGLPQAYAMFCVPLLGAWLTIEGPARQRRQLSAEDRVRWALARLHTRKLDYGLALAAPALAWLQPPLLLLLAPLLASVRLAGQILVLEAQKDEAGQAYQALSRVQSQARNNADQLQRAQRDKKLLEGFAAHLSGAPSLSESAQALVHTVFELAAADDVALFLVSGENQLEPFYYSVQPEHQSLLQGSLLTGVREAMVDHAWESQQPQKRLGSHGAQLFQRNDVALALPLEQWGVLYVGRVHSRPFTPAELESLQWLTQKACLTLAVSLREQQTRQLQQGQRRAIAGLQRQLEISAWLMESARKLGGALLVAEVVQQFAEVLGSTIPHEQRFLLLSMAEECQFLSLPDEAASPASRAILQELAGVSQPLLLEELSARFAAAFPGMKSLVGVPLHGGAVVLASSRPFTREQSEVLFLMASQASMALARAQAHEQVLEGRRQLEASQAQLIQSSKLTAIGQLAAGIAHELNTPLGAVGLSLSAARENFQSRPERALKMFERAREGLDRALSIIEKLLIYSRRPSQEFVPVDMGTLVQDTLAFLKSSEVRVELHLMEGLRVLGKPQDLQQVLVNLLNNAQQAVADQGEERKVVAIRGWSEQGKVLLELRDRGQGIPPADLPRIFEPFFTTRPVGQGTGLGLSIAHQIVELHQGKLEVSSRLGEGTRCLLSLPGA
ncbi:MAG: GHKL domain-containing protein [Candidatus Eremiobacteraeota bacterium]|nr:GHKL domain-containing protein [Candidatus Eremiobacteraeota bacterium]MCW5872753.1 GHKL domain-containing protein [Candidatus Eremiobacteraeota bacterium]